MQMTREINVNIVCIPGFSPPLCPSRKPEQVQVNQCWTVTVSLEWSAGESAWLQRLIVKRASEGEFGPDENARCLCLSVCLSLPYPTLPVPSCPVCRECWAVLQPDKREVKRALRMASEVVDLDIRDMSAKS